jgi:hypothetical protein
MAATTSSSLAAGCVTAVSNARLYQRRDAVDRGR